MWSISIGRVGGVRLRLHVSFAVAAVTLLYLGWVAQTTGQVAWSNTWTIILLGIWLFSVLVHESGHALAAWRLRLPRRDVNLGPTGGIGPATIDAEAPAELLAESAGPLANLGLCLLAAVAMAVLRDSGPSDAALAMGAAASSTRSDAIFVARMFLWVNWALVLVNLLPAFPLDGGRMMRAALHLVSPHLAHRETVLFVARLGRLIAVALLVASLLAHEYLPLPILPGWVVGVLLAVIICFSSAQLDQPRDSRRGDELPFGYDFSEGYTSLERSVSVASSSPPVQQRSHLVGGWFQRWRERRLATRRARESNEDLLVDEILSRVHDGGLDALSPEQQRLLRRVSQRYRRRGR